MTSEFTAAAIRTILRYGKLQRKSEARFSSRLWLWRRCLSFCIRVHLQLLLHWIFSRSSRGVPGKTWVPGQLAKCCRCPLYIYVMPYSSALSRLCFLRAAKWERAYFMSVNESACKTQAKLPCHRLTTLYVHYANVKLGRARFFEQTRLCALRPPSIFMVQLIMLTSVCRLRFTSVFLGTLGSKSATWLHFTNKQHCLITAASCWFFSSLRHNFKKRNVIFLLLSI